MDHANITCPCAFWLVCPPQTRTRRCTLSLRHHRSPRRTPNPLLPPHHLPIRLGGHCRLDPSRQAPAGLGI